MRNLLIIFTDEVGSTGRDCRAGADEGKILAPRHNLFTLQVATLKGKGWTVLKNVGDSLVIKHEGIANTRAKAILDLFLAWQKRHGAPEARIRVAIHGPCSNSFVSGKKLRERLACDGIPQKPLRWPSFEALEDDLFGLEMNLASRLVSLSTDHAFVISDNVLTPAVRRSLCACLRPYSYYVGPRVPVTYLKGFEEYLSFCDQPSLCKECSGCRSQKRVHWVREILPCVAEGEELSVSQFPCLIEDAKRFQAIRTILMVYTATDIATGADRPEKQTFFDGAVKAAYKRLSALVGSNGEQTAFGFHLDALFRVDQTWSGQPVRLNRQPPPVTQSGGRSAPPWLSVEAIKKDKDFACLPITFVLFSSTFDENGDRLLGACLRNSKVEASEEEVTGFQDITVKCQLLPESHLIHKRAYWHSEARKVKALYYLYYFQIRNDAPYGADQVRNFRCVSTRVGSLAPVGWGLLRGGIDGYVLYRHTGSAGDDAVVSEINKHVMVEKPITADFLSNTIPLRLQKLTLLVDQPTEEAARAVEWSSEEKWRHFIDPSADGKPASRRRSSQSTRR